MLPMNDRHDRRGCPLPGRTRRSFSCAERPGGYEAPGMSGNRTRTFAEGIDQAIEYCVGVGPHAIRRRALFQLMDGFVEPAGPVTAVIDQPRAVVRGKMPTIGNDHASSIGLEHAEAAGQALGGRRPLVEPFVGGIRQPVQVGRDGLGLGPRQHAGAVPTPRSGLTDVEKGQDCSRDGRQARPGQNAAILQ
jgi:hypothetical protein